MPAEKNRQHSFVELHDVADGLPAVAVDRRLYVGSVPTPAHRVVCATLAEDANLVVAATVDKKVLVLQRSERSAAFDAKAEQ